MNEINWNGCYYKEGGTLLHNGEVKIIKQLETDVVQNGTSIFDRTLLLRVITEDGKIVEIQGR